VNSSLTWEDEVQKEVKKVSEPSIATDKIPKSIFSRKRESHVMEAAEALTARGIDI
jgi:hypothetical protein